MLKRIIRHPQAVVGLVIMVVILITAVSAPLLAPNPPDDVDPGRKYRPPSAQYPLGTDHLGRCEWSRLMYGARYSLGLSLPILLTLSLIGLVLGTLAVTLGDRADRAIVMVCDIFVSFPTLLVAVAVISALGNGFVSVAVAVVIGSWAQFVRVVRSFARMEMGKDYILASRIAGCGTASVVFRHMIPNILPPFLVYVSTGVAASILMVSAFAFLGLGLPAGTPEWGAMLSEARGGLYRHPEMLLYPGLCILLTAGGFNLFGEALRDIVMQGDGL